MLYSRPFVYIYRHCEHANLIRDSVMDVLCEKKVSEVLCIVITVTIAAFHVSQNRTQYYMQFHV